MRRRLALLVLAIMAIASTAHGDDSRPGARVVKGKLTPAAWAGMFVRVTGPDKRISVNQQLPQLRLYDAGGRELLRHTGYGGATDRVWLTNALAAPPPANAALLSQFLEIVRTADGKPLAAADLPKDGPVAAVLGAVWCMPCKALKADLEQISGITVLDIDVDQKSMPWPEIARIIRTSEP